MQREGYPLLVKFPYETIFIPYGVEPPLVEDKDEEYLMLKNLSDKM